MVASFRDHEKVAKACDARLLETVDVAELAAEICRALPGAHLGWAIMAGLHARVLRRRKAERRAARVAARVASKQAEPVGKRADNQRSHGRKGTPCPLGLLTASGNSPEPA